MDGQPIDRILDFGPIVRGRFVERVNRFLVRCHLKDQGEIEAHLPNPGRLWELLLPGAILYLSRPKASPAKSVSIRRTNYTAVAVERQGHPVFLHTHATNGVARFLIENGRVPLLAGAEIIKTEQTVGRSRFDFLLRQGAEEVLLEVKSVTLFGNGIAMFPDAVTARGKKHMQELAMMGRNGVVTAVLFIVHYPGVKWFMPDYHTDLEFSTAMLACRHHVQMIPVAVSWTADLDLADRVRELEIPWAYLEAEVKDRGGYLLILELRKEKTLAVGGLGRRRFRKGYYVYVGSAMKGLTARIRRHKQREKQCRWHIDYLSTVADRVIALPIRSSGRMECEVAQGLSAIMAQGPTGFGSSDCLCISHLFWGSENPLYRRDFHDMLQSFRMRCP